MFLYEVKRLIWSALEIEFFELYFLQPVLGGHPVLRQFLCLLLKEAQTKGRFTFITANSQTLNFLFKVRRARVTARDLLTATRARLPMFSKIEQRLSPG